MVKRTRTKKNKATNGKDIIEEILNKGSLDKDNNTNQQPLQTLDNKFVLNQLRREAEQGDVRALELLGKHLNMFSKDSEKEDIIDIFCDDGTLEENILKMLDILEDKYYDELNNSITMLRNEDTLYMSEKEREILLRQLEEQHQSNLEYSEKEKEKDLNNGTTRQVNFDKDLEESLDDLDAPTEQSNNPSSPFLSI